MSRSPPKKTEIDKPEIDITLAADVDVAAQHNGIIDNDHDHISTVLSANEPPKPPGRYLWYEPKAKPKPEAAQVPSAQASKAPGRYLWERSNTEPEVKEAVFTRPRAFNNTPHASLVLEPEVEEKTKDADIDSDTYVIAGAVDNKDEKPADNEENSAKKDDVSAADALQMHIAQMTLRDVTVRMADCDDVNAVWQERLADAEVAVTDVATTCQALIKRNHQSEKTYKRLQGENTRLQERVKQTNYILDTALRHRFQPEVDVNKPGYMVQSLLASLPPSAFEY